MRHYIAQYGEEIALCGKIENRDCTPLLNHVTCPECKKLGMELAENRRMNREEVKA